MNMEILISIKTENLQLQPIADTNLNLMDSDMRNKLFGMF